MKNCCCKCKPKRLRQNDNPVFPPIGTNSTVFLYTSPADEKHVDKGENITLNFGPIPPDPLFRLLPLTPDTPFNPTQGSIQFNNTTPVLYNVNIDILNINRSAVDIDNVVIQVYLRKHTGDQLLYSKTTYRPDTELPHHIIILNSELKFNGNPPIYENGDILSIVNQTPNYPFGYYRYIHLYPIKGVFVVVTVTPP